MTAIDVANAIRSQNLDAPAGQVGQPPCARRQAFQLPIDTLGRLTDPEQFGDIIVKVGRRRPPSRAGQAPSRRRRSDSRLPQPRQHRPLQRPATTAGTTAQPGGSARAAARPRRPTSSGSGSTTRGAMPAGVTAAAARPAAAATTGGGTTGGGATTGGGGTTGGGATTAAAPRPAARPTGHGRAPASGVTGLSISTGADAGTEQRRPRRPDAGPRTGRRRPAIVRLRDVARVELGAQNYNQAAPSTATRPSAWPSSSSPAPTPSTSPTASAAKMEELKTRFPEGVTTTIAYDTTPFIRESVDDVVQTLLEAVVLVGVVVLVFLQNWRAVIIPLIAVPVAIVGTFAVMAALGFSLNNISLFGLVLAIGIVVDDAIVVVENVERWLEQGARRARRRRKAMDEITGPIIAIALVLCAVFVPCAFISGITGQFFRQFAVTIAASTIFSAFNSLTLSPALAAILLQAARCAAATR